MPTINSMLYKKFVLQFSFFSLSLFLAKKYLQILNSVCSRNRGNDIKNSTATKYNLLLLHVCLRFIVVVSFLAYFFHFYSRKRYDCPSITINVNTSPQVLVKMLKASRVGSVVVIISACIVFSLHASRFFL